jgi:transcriptional regulator with XRE-family HTH domain
MSSQKMKKAKAREEELDERTLKVLIQNVRKRRRALGLSQAQASLAGGLEPQYLTAFENGHRRNPTLATCIKIAKGLDTTLVALLGSAESS